MCIRAEVRVGEILNDMPKASGGDRKSEIYKNKIDSGVEFQNKKLPNTTTPKVEVVEDKPKLQTKALGKFPNVQNAKQVMGGVIHQCAK